MRVGFTCAWLWFLLVTSVPASAQTQAWHDLSAPASAFEAAGVPLDGDRSQLMLRLVRVVHSVPAGHSRDDAALQRLTASLKDASVTLSAPVISLPLPLSPKTWADVILERPLPQRALFSAIITDRNASLLYYGLCGLSAETRDFLNRNPELLRWIYRERAGALAAYGASTRIVRGQLDLPGGEPARPLWETLLDERVSQPAAFVKRLLDRDDGRLAYFYESIDSLDAPRQRFALGLALKDSEQRAERFKLLYRAFVGIEADDSLIELPFARPMYDAATLLHVARVTPDGTLAAPAFRKLWRLAFDTIDLPGDPVDRVGDVTDEGVLDAAAVAELVALAPARNRRARFETFAFGQRAFATATAHDSADVLVALRAFARFPALMLLVERIGVSSPSIYASIARHARAIEEIDDADRQTALLAQFQGALAILDRLVRTGSLTLAESERLLRSAEAIVPDPSYGYRGRMFAWIEHGLLASLGANATAAGQIERHLLEGMADAEAEPGRRFDWEGLPYVVSIAASETRRIEAIRSKQAGNTLDGLLAFWRDVDALSGPAMTLDGIKKIAASLGTYAAKLSPAKPWPGLNADSVPNVRKIVDRAVNDLADIRKPSDVRKAARVADALTVTADYLLGEVLVALAYAPVLGDPDQLLGGEADVAHKHDFGVVTTPSAEARKRTPWQRPRRANGTPVTGSLLGLDLVLAPHSLRRLATDRVPELPRLKANDRDVFASSVVLINPRLMNDAALSRIAAAIKEGRRRIAEAGSNIAALEALAGTARMSASRRQLLSWAAENDPAGVPNLFSIREMLDVGAAAEPDLARDPLGLAEEALTGCYCVRFPAPGPWEIYSGRPGTGQLALRVPDLTLRVTELLAELNAPAALLPAVLALATQDFIDEVPALYPDDWPAAVAHARALPRERVEDYIAALTAMGPLRPYATSQQ